MKCFHSGLFGTVAACKDIDDPHAYKPNQSEPEPEINLMVKHNICSEIKYNLLG